MPLLSVKSWVCKYWITFQVIKLKLLYETWKILAWYPNKMRRYRQRNPKCNDWCWTNFQMQVALKDCEYKEKIQFQQYEHQQIQSKRNRSWKIIWFNSPFSSNVETNVGRTFLKLVKKHCSKYRYHKVFNKNNIK